MRKKNRLAMAVRRTIDPKTIIDVNKDNCLIYSGAFEDKNMVDIAKIVKNNIDCKLKVQRDGNYHMIYFIGSKKNCFIADMTMMTLSEYITDRCRRLVRLYMLNDKYSRTKCYKMADNYMLGWIDGLDAQYKRLAQEGQSKPLRLVSERSLPMLQDKSMDYLEKMKNSSKNCHECETSAYVSGLDDGMLFNLREHVKNLAEVM